MSGPDPQPQPTDEQLVEAANRGDAHAFETLYRRYRDWVIALAWRFTRDRDLALDIAQEVFIYLLRQFPGFELRARLTTFLYPVVRHTALATLRKARREITGSDSLADRASAQPAAPTPTEQDLHRRELAQALASLSHEHRETLLMRFVDGFSLAEIAEATAVPLGTVKSRLHHALARLHDDPTARKFLEP